MASVCHLVLRTSLSSQQGHEGDVEPGGTRKLLRRGRLEFLEIT